MKKITLFVSILFCRMYLSAQIDDGWVEVGNAAYNSQLNSIAFISNDVGYAVGSGGSFLKTSNGGITWTALNIGFNYHFQQIVFVNASTGFLAGNVYNYNISKLLKTTDGGNTWQEIYSDNAYCRMTYFYNGSIGFIAGQNWYAKTNDGGTTWERKIFSTMQRINSMVFLTANKGIMASDGGAFITNDGGDNWVQFKSETYNDVVFLDANCGYLASDQLMHLLYTADGGTTWNPTSDIGLPNAGHAFFTNPLVGYSWVKQEEGPSGNIVKTINGGSTWTNVFSDQSCNIKDMVRKQDGSIFVCGKGGLILKSSDGDNFTEIHRGQLFNTLNRICFVNDSTAFAVGNGGILVKTTDRCSTWITLNSSVTENLYGICAVSPTTLYIVGTGSTLLKSTDAGITWVPSNTGFFSALQTGGDINFLNADVGFAGQSGLYKTINGGASWYKVLDTPAYDFAFPNSDTLYTGAFHAVYRSVNGGESWSIISSASYNVWGVDFFTPRHGVFSYVSHIYSTTDAGENWDEESITNPDAGNSFMDIVMKNNSNFTVVGRNGSIYNSEDAGANWNKILSNTTRDFTRLTYGPDGTGYILGQDAIVLRRAVVQTFTLNFALNNAQGDPITNASLTINGVSYPAGTYSFPGLLPGMYNWSISCEGYCIQTGITNLSDDFTEVLVLENCYETFFILSNVYNQPVGGANVTLSSYGTQQTDASGLAIFTVHANNNLAYEITAGNYVPQTGNIGVLCDTVFNFNLPASLNAPVALDATDIENYSFYANWTIPENADSCLLYVSEDEFVTCISGFNGLAFTENHMWISGIIGGKEYKYRLKAKNEYGISVFSNIVQVNTTTTGISELSKNACIKVYPNPASENIAIHLPVKGDYLVTVIDLHGKQVLNKKCFGNETLELSVSGLSVGVYSVRLSNNNRQFIGTFVKY